MGAQSSLLGLVGATGLAVSKIAETGAQLAEDKKEKKKALEEEKSDENEVALEKADIMLKKAKAEEDLDKLNEGYKKDKETLKMWKQGMVDVGNGTYMQTSDDLSKDIKIMQRSLKIQREKRKARNLQISALKDKLNKLNGGNK